LTITAGGVLSAATATVVKVDSGVAGFQTAGIVQDSARRLYLTSATEQVVLLAQDVKQAPQVYAGIPKSAGLTDGPRTQARFNNPSFLTLNQSDGSLYVSDAVNHVIRRVTAGGSGRVETLAGSGASGDRDGSLKDASFVSPQGIALDERGNLWIADSGSHTIRRINLGRGTVETVAGLAGIPGFIDGKGGAVRFNTPAG